MRARVARRRRLRLDHRRHRERRLSLGGALTRTRVALVALVTLGGAREAAAIAVGGGLAVEDSLGLTRSTSSFRPDVVARDRVALAGQLLVGVTPRLGLRLTLAEELAPLVSVEPSPALAARLGVLVRPFAGGGALVPYLAGDGGLAGIGAVSRGELRASVGLAWRPRRPGWFFVWAESFAALGVGPATSLHAGLTVGVTLATTSCWPSLR